MYYESLKIVDENLFLGGLIAFIIALIVTIPIVYKI